MKQFVLFVVISVIFSVQILAQNPKSENVPEMVLSAFSVKFTDAKKVKWEMEEAAGWEAEFKWKAKEYSANFSTNGDWIVSEYKIKKSEISANIRAILDKNFSDYHIEEAEISQTESGNYYEIEIELKEEEFEVIIDFTGNLIKKKKSTKND